GRAEERNLLVLSLLLDSEILGLESGDGFALPVGNDHIHQDEVSTDPDRGRRNFTLRLRAGRNPSHYRNHGRDKYSTPQPDTVLLHDNLRLLPLWTDHKVFCLGCYGKYFGMAGRSILESRTSVTIYAQPSDMDPHTVLIIDDEEAGLYVRKLVLEAEGYQVVSALDGMQGLKVFRRQRVDAVITDQVMPGLDGVQVAREIKQQNRRVPVIMLSAIPTEPEGAGAVVDAFVVKGQSPAVLLERLGSLLRIRRHSHEDFDGKYVAFVDQNRKYLDVTDGVCELLGYSRSELLRMRIDDVAAPQEVKNVPPLFERYVSEKSLDGIFRLQNRQGNILRIRYHSRVFPDGCMVARWEPQL